MTIINLQEKATAKTHFHRIAIPLKSFGSGLEHEKQPVNTAVVFNWLNLNLRDPLNMDKLIFVICL